MPELAVRAAVVDVVVEVFAWLEPQPATVTTAAKTATVRHLMIAAHRPAIATSGPRPLIPPCT
jgi:hypothetical protein